MTQSFAYALQVLQALPESIAAGKSVLEFINQSNAALQKMQAEGRDPTPTEWDTLNAQIDGLRQQLHGQGVNIHDGSEVAAKVTIAAPTLLKPAAVTTVSKKPVTEKYDY